MLFRSASGKLSLAQKALAEQSYFAICRRLYNQLKARQRSHRAVLDELNDKLADKYICNFSVFQSLPDSWALDQVFPICPLHRLLERPSRSAVLADITCDSDGVIDPLLFDRKRTNNNCAVGPFLRYEQCAIRLACSWIREQSVGIARCSFIQRFALPIE